jgi:osmotically-inducible protein OsmY
VHAIEELAQTLLWGSPYLALRDISCEYQEGVLTLQGRLPTYYLKLMAQSVVADVEGVTAIVNKIEVMTPIPRAASGREVGRCAWA